MALALSTEQAHPAGSAPGLAALIAARALEEPGAVYLVSARTRRSVTFGQLDALRAAWADVLGPSGPASWRIGVAVRDPVAFAVSLLGVVAAGGTVAPLDPTLPDAGLERACGRLHLGAVLADRPAPNSGLDIPWLRPPRRGLDLLGPGAVAGLAELRSVRPAPSGEGPPLPSGVVLATSGTTGAPKLIALDQHQLLHTARAVARHHRLSRSDIGFSPLPLWHINAEVVGLLATLVSGGRLVVDDRFHRRDLWFQLGAHRVSWLNAVPAILARSVPLRDGETVPGELRFARSASAPLSHAVLRRFEEATAVPVVETYGMTEASSQITANPVGVGRRPGTVGVPVGVELRVRSVLAAPGAFVAAAVGEPGAVEIRGPGVVTAYADGADPGRFDTGSWFDTGDVGSLDADGYLTLLGRSDDVINRGGEKIHPRVVEEVLLDDPAIAAAAVVGRPDDALGAVPVAHLVLAAGAEGPAVVERARRRCIERLGRALIPVDFLVADELPAGQTGKIRRHELVARSLSAVGGR